MHLAVERDADVYVSFLRDLMSYSTIAKHFIEDGQSYAFYDTVQMLRTEFEEFGYVVRTPEFRSELMSADKKHPPFILASPRRMDPNKPTILVHAHYDNVSTAEGGWAHDPLQMGRKDGYLTGRGVSSKSVIAAWISALAVMKKTKTPIGVNVKFVLDPLGELGSSSLDSCLAKENSGFFRDISAAIVCQGQWMTDKQPTIVYGQRGVQNYYMNIKGGEKRVDAGRYAGLVREPLMELMYMMSNLTALDQTTLFPRLTSPKLPLFVADVSKEETKAIDDLNVTLKQLKETLGVKQLKTLSRTEAIQRIWREPAVSITSIKSGFEPEEEYQTTIPKHATARFSIRTVPNMDFETADNLLKHYFTTLHKSMKTRTELHIKCLYQYPWWLSSRHHWNYDTASKAIKSVWKVAPDYTREGGSSPVAALLEKHLKTNVLCLPIGKPSDQPKTVDENFDEVHYINAIKTFCSYLFYSGDMSRNADKFIAPDAVKGLRQKTVKQKESKMSALIPTPPGSKPLEPVEPRKTKTNPQLESKVFQEHFLNKTRLNKQVTLDVELAAKKEKPKGKPKEKTDKKPVEENSVKEKPVKEQSAKEKSAKEKPVKEKPTKKDPVKKEKPEKKA
ncbi:Cys-Gly metallodipeptidase dug1 [Yarrowia sp. C11]|nr:Cys-Gly metallodipeptidase dug1 [Yarrowia sp. C11]